MHMLILFITIYLFILLKVSIAKIKKEGAQNIIFDLKRFYGTKKNIKTLKVFYVILKTLKDTA